MSETIDKPHDSANIDDVIADYIRSEEAGESPDRQALLKEHPAFADELRRFFGDRDAFRRMARPLNPPSTTPDPAVATLRYFGDYELIEEIARGGMGVVYKARQVSLNRIVAVKMILAGHLASDEDIKRFQTEAEAAANLQHPNIVAVHEVGIHEGQHYFSMDYVDGSSLAEIIRKSPLPAEQAACYVNSVAEAVHQAHQQGTLHRDLKPSNVLIDSNDSVRITDFGLASRVSADSDLTRTGQALGTPAYMPPEQAIGRRDQIGPTSDVYSLGAILYELLTGRPPFQADTTVETIRQVLDNEPVSPRLLNPSVPRDLETVCLKSLEKEPSKRYASAGELSKDLGRFVAGEAILARPIRRVERTWRWCKRNPIVAGLMVAVFTSLVAGTAISTSFGIKANSRHKQALRNLYIARMREMGGPLEKRETSQLFKFLDASTPVAGEPDFRGWEWYFLRDFCRQQMTVLPIRATTDSPRVAWSPDGNLLATAANGVEIWDRSTWQRIGVFGTETMSCLAWNDKGDRLAVGTHNGRIEIWDPISGERRDAFQAHSKVVGIAWFSDGRRLVSGGPSTDGEVKVWDVETKGVQLRLSDEAVQDVMNLALNPRENIVAIAHQGNLVSLWNLTTNTLIRTRSAGRKYAWNVAWSPDGEYLATGGGVPSGDIELWNRNGETVHSLKGHTAVVESVAWSPDSSFIATSGYDHTIRIWSVAGAVECIDTRRIHSGAARLIWHPSDDLIASSGFDLTVKIWHATAKREISQKFLPESGYASAWSSDGSWIAVRRGQTVVIFDAIDGREVLELDGQASQVVALAWSPDNTQVASLGEDGEVIAWHLTSKTKKLSLRGPYPAGRQLVWNPQYELLASGSNDGGLQIWDSVSGAHVANSDLSAYALCWGPDGEQLAFGGTDGLLRIWDRKTQRTRELPRDSGSSLIMDIAWRPDGKVIALCTVVSSVIFFDIATGKEIHTLQGHSSIVERIAWSGNSRIATGTNDGNIVVWDDKHLDRILTLDGHRDRITALSWTPDGGRLLSLSRNGAARIWGSSELEEIPQPVRLKAGAVIPK